VKRRTGLAVTLIIVVGLAAGVGGYIRGVMTASPGLGELVRIESPRRGGLVECVNAPGEIEPRTHVAISARVMARIVELPFDEGDGVTKGDPTAQPPIPPSVLVRLDATDLEAALRAAEARRAAQAAQIKVEKSRIAGQRAAIEGIDASLLAAERDLRRCEDLVKSRDMSQAELDQARRRHDELKAQRASAEHVLRAAEANLEVLQHNLEAADADIERARDAVGYTTITSPIDGVITRVNAKVGELVVVGTMNNPGTVIMSVADLSEMLVVVRLDEAGIADVEVGQRAVVRIHAYPDETFSGVVESIALTHDFGPGGTKYFKTKILLEADKRVYSGLTADVDIQTKTHSDVLKVPSQAVLGRPTDELPVSIRENNPNVDTKKAIATVVYRFIDGKAVVTPVTVGASDETHTVIASGLTTEDRVVVGPYKVLDGLRHGQKLRDEREVEKAGKASDEQ